MWVTKQAVLKFKADKNTIKGRKEQSIWVSHKASCIEIFKSNFVSWWSFSLIANSLTKIFVCLILTIFSSFFLWIEKSTTGFKGKLILKYFFYIFGFKWTFSTFELLEEKLCNIRSIESWFEFWLLTFESNKSMFVKWF